MLTPGTRVRSTGTSNYTKPNLYGIVQRVSCAGVLVEWIGPLHPALPRVAWFAPYWLETIA